MRNIGPAAVLLLATLVATPVAQADGRPPPLLTNIHRAVMAEARYVPDAPGHDIWRASTVGDCEDFALEMARRLSLGGMKRSAMRILVEWNRQYATWHAVLLVEVGGARWRLDSLEPAPRPWDGSGIEWEVTDHGRRIVAVNGQAIPPGAWRR